MSKCWKCNREFYSEYLSQTLCDECLGRIPQTTATSDFVNLLNKEMDDTPFVKVMHGGTFKVLSIEEYEEMTNKIADLEAKLSKLLQRVSEQNEELANRPTMEDLYPPQMIKLANQDKISFAVEKLEKVKTRIQEDFDYDDLMYWLNKQIKMLKEGK